MKVGFIGAGKVGCSLGKLFAETQHNLTGFYSLTSSSAESAAEFTNSTYFQNLEDLIQDSDTVFITVPDDSIERVWEQPFRLLCGDADPEQAAQAEQHRKSDGFHASAASTRFPSAS